tara:strand:+ start:676 stop:870 length:195 start_codon:yes stop_codon:yes gene_type:complete
LGGVLGGGFCISRQINIGIPPSIRNVTGAQYVSYLKVTKIPTNQIPKVASPTTKHPRPFGISNL